MNFKYERFSKINYEILNQLISIISQNSKNKNLKIINLVAVLIFLYLYRSYKEHGFVTEDEKITINHISLDKLQKTLSSLVGRSKQILITAINILEKENLISVIRKNGCKNIYRIDNRIQDVYCKIPHMFTSVKILLKFSKFNEHNCDAVMVYFILLQVTTKEMIANISKSTILDKLKWSKRNNIRIKAALDVLYEFKLIELVNNRYYRNDIYLIKLSD